VKANEYDFELVRAFSTGDNPQSVDRCLTKFPPMPFVSVSQKEEFDGGNCNFVGGEEDGFADFLKVLVDELDAQENPTINSEIIVRVANTVRGRRAGH